MNCMMNVIEARNYLEQAGRSGINLGLSRMKKLLEYLDNPQDKLLFIHVAGTNGKGSVSSYITSVLAAGGKRVGRYVSPAVFCPEEFIQYEDNQGTHVIGDEIFVEVVTKVAAAAELMVKEKKESWMPTRFELETAMAFLAFLKWKCDVVVLEVGLGGREDATNVVENVLLSVITPVAMDHMAVLGDTIEKIAAEKAGIIKRGVPVVTMQDDERAEAVIKSEAEKMNCAFFSVDKKMCRVEQCGLDGSRFWYDGFFETGMVGRYQIRNACLAITVCRHLPSLLKVTEEQIGTGIKKAIWRGRFEVVSRDPLVILDGAHNPAGARALRETIEELNLDKKKLHAIMGVFKDKAYEKMVGILVPLFYDVVTITPESQRGLEKEMLADVWRKNGCRNVGVAENVGEAVELAKKRSKKGEGIVVFGSLSFMKDIGDL